MQTNYLNQCFSEVTGPNQDTNFFSVYNTARNGITWSKLKANVLTLKKNPRKQQNKM